MNKRVLLRTLGVISLVVGGTMVLPLAWSFYFYLEAGEEDFPAILYSMGVALLVGLVLIAAGGGHRAGIQRREGLAVVGLGWLLAAALAALPFYFSGAVPDWIDAYFEAMSGLTTTGSTVLDDIESVPRGILLWRSLTQWIGGMGIVVLFVAIIPYLRAGGKQLLYTEVPGPRSETLSPRIRDTAVLLWKFYVSFSILLASLLLLQGMSFYDALCHTFATMSTGGFSPRAASIGHYDSAVIEMTVIVFMIIAGTNFGLFYRVFQRDWRAVFRDSEWRFFILVLLVGSAVVAGDLYAHGIYASPAEAVRVATFQTVSLTTTTGFGTADFDAWPSLSRCLLVFLFFVGGCAGSTAGGIKVVRILVISKNALLATEHAIRPQTVRALRVGGAVVEPEVRETILAFFTIIMGTMVLGTLAMASLGLDPVSALSAVAACLNNIGPGLGNVGATESFSAVPPAGKLLLAVIMVVGRLEVFAILVLFSPRLWHAH